MTDLTGRTALVTGASSALGRHFSELLAAKGAIVIAAAQRMPAPEDLADGIRLGGGRCQPVAINVTDAV